MVGSVEWGTVPDWIAAIGTAGALIATAVLLRHEIRERHAAEEESLVRQARQITLTVRSSWSGYKGPGDTIHGPFSVNGTFTITNGSTEPIRDVGVYLEDSFGEKLGAYELGIVRAGESKSGGDHRMNTPDRRDPVRGRAAFLDVNGRGWVVSDAGRLGPRPRWPADWTTEDLSPDIRGYGSTSRDLG